MITEAAISLLFLYPWNINTGVNYTIGDYSTNRTYRSEKVVVSLDRRGRDTYVASYEHLTIEDDIGTYKQDNVLLRSSLWLRNEARIGMLGGYIQSNSIEEGWLLGAQIEGDLPWFGYSVDYTYEQFRRWDLTYYWIVSDFPISQWNFGLSRKIGILHVRAEALTQNSQSTENLRWLAKATIDPGIDLAVTLYGSTGESRYAVDPYLLLIDNNPDILNQSYGVYTTYRLTPNFTLSCEALRKEYSPRYDFIGITDYHVGYLGFGIQTRF